MPLQIYQARTSQHTLIKGKFQYVTFELVHPPIIDFQAGQFIMMNIPGIAAKRSYSIASNPAENNKVEILVDVGPQGDGSLYLQSLNPGEAVSFMAPGGQFVIAPDPAEQKLIMIATGSGISAIRSMILNLLQTKNDLRPITLIWGLRFPEDIFWEDDFRLLEKQFTNFHFDLVLSKAPPGWPLCTGHVTDCLEKHFPDLSATGFYLCGNQKMIEGVKAVITAKGIQPQNIHHERFF
jgi:phenol/toluene 2-monooxygenase (NADH) P5/A5